jgi:hypothetical protein
MKKIVYFIFLIFIFTGCHVSENKRLKETISQLEEELDLYKNGEQRLFALIEQGVKSGNISSAKENITLLEYYHPESLNKPEIKQIIAIVTKEEENIARIAAEKEATEKAAVIERQKGFNNPNAASARVIDVIEANFHDESKQLKNGEYFIVRPGYYERQNGNTIWIYNEKNLRGTYITVTSNQLFRLDSGTRVSLLLRASYGKTVLGAERCFFDLVELQTY